MAKFWIKSITSKLKDDTLCSFENIDNFKSSFEEFEVYKDVKNLVESAYYKTEGGESYRTYINKDYANIKGFHVSFERSMGNVRGYVRYNYESAKGKNSSIAWASRSGRTASAPACSGGGCQ